MPYRVQPLILSILLACLLSCLLPFGAAAQTPPGDPDEETVPQQSGPMAPPGREALEALGKLRTRAELTNFEATGSYDETIDFIKKVQAHFPELYLGFYGTSGQGRPLPFVVVSREKAFTGRKAQKLAKPIVLIQNGIHAGEIDGKDASLMILRDLAAGRHREILERVTLVVLPIYNVDGHERVSPYNRPNQDGPRQGMGFRTTANGLDLNRDHLKISSEEARSLIALVNAWRPHLHVDDHVTDGVDHDWVLTWSWAEAPQAPAPVDAWMRGHLPAVLAATAKAGHKNGPYTPATPRPPPSAASRCSLTAAARFGRSRCPGITSRRSWRPSPVPAATWCSRAGRRSRNGCAAMACGSRGSPSRWRSRSRRCGSPSRSRPARATRG